MKVAIIGYGKMGKEIETICKQRGHEIPLIIDFNNAADLNKENLSKVDVAIEFSTPGTAYQNILKCFEANVPVVAGTTGWIDKLDEVKRLVDEKELTFFYTSNYSLGVNIFFKINKELARLMNAFPEYEVSLEETHHITKLDAPSGTAITLANDLIQNLDRKKDWKLDTKAPETIDIHAIRRDTVPGIHTIKYDSAVDFIEITHSAKNRQGLAFGAVLAAEFVIGKKGFLGMNDLLKF
jgi:4-hydroxy-tetrahydrodipicolinate reductase